MIAVANNSTFGEPRVELRALQMLLSDGENTLHSRRIGRPMGGLDADWRPQWLCDTVGYFALTGSWARHVQSDAAWSMMVTESCYFLEVPGEHMGRALTVIGIIALIGAFAWWQTFYGEVQRFLGAPGPLPIECLYSMSSACRMMANAAELFGANSYHPLIFWTACGCLLIGLVMGWRIGAPKRRSRNRIRSRPRS